VKGNLFILLLIALSIISCASGRYSLADRYLKESDYQSALDEYIRIAKSKTSLSMSRDIRALTGAMIAYYQLGKYKSSFAMSKRILSLNRFNSSAIFYAGMCLEKLNKLRLAKKVYRFYAVLSRFDPYYKLIKARFNQLIQLEMEKRARLAIKMENSITPDKINANTVGVLYFLNVVDDPEWNSLSKGLAEMMITDLSQVKSLKVLERIYLQKLIEEMQLGMSGLTDEKTVPRIGRLLRAKNLINGAFTIKASQNLTVTSSFLDVIGGENVPIEEFSGDLTKIFDIEKEIVFAVLDKMGIRLTAEERKKIGTKATRSIEAFKAYCRGLDQYDIGNYTSAMLNFQEALKIDPNFMLAQDMFDMTNALGIIEHGNFVAMHFEMLKPKFASETGRRNGVSPRFRLSRLSHNLELGYLPGNDSRNGASELIIRDEFTREDWQNREPLQPPPPPPAAPPGN